MDKSEDKVKMKSCFTIIHSVRSSHLKDSSGVVKDIFRKQNQVLFEFVN